MTEMEIRASLLKGWKKEKKEKNRERTAPRKLVLLPRTPFVYSWSIGNQSDPFSELIIIAFFVKPASYSRLINSLPH